MQYNKVIGYISILQSKSNSRRFPANKIAVKMQIFDPNVHLPDLMYYDTSGRTLTHTYLAGIVIIIDIWSALACWDVANTLYSC